LRSICVAIGVILAGAIAVGRNQVSQAEGETCTFTVQNDVPATMRDGTILRANVFTPDPPGPYPVIMIRLPYNKDRPMTNSYGAPDVWAAHCYIVVSQDVRGQYKSDGAFYPFRHEAADGYDTGAMGGQAAQIERQGRHVRAVVSGRDAMAAGDARSTASLRRSFPP
jgi:hypothetical protein